MVKSDLAVGPLKWSGRAWLAPGLAVFAGRAGHQDWHHHQAHQIAIGLDVPVTVECPQRQYTGFSVFIPAGVRHRISGALIVSIYLDVLADEAQVLPQSMTPMPIEIAPSDAKRIADSLNEGAGDPRSAVRKALQVLDVLPAPDPRVTIVSTAIHEGKVRREELAALVHLSPTRFSHWFVEQTGLPLRSYVKWLRLTQAVQYLACGRSMTDAAHESGFSDSAHFSRTFHSLLGIDPSSALAEVYLQEAVAARV
ncbi:MULTISPECIES: helix-turn-helix transcriptional regulator [Pseudomonadaceae]|uniref:AraC family transcriptional regulator n=2 Tax=Pseudomonadaceae TaxID=135621 RepID=A0AA42IS39_9GAMM|nr:MULTISPECIES: AraC family transcriptional regulator [Pseudomonas]PKM33073.1 MAG: AraC family transcriptional regulator [Gammaproteobacteria bacterium HGW-Gammaproteobacteria-12]MBA4682383.1 AraC family transcriptional regulator [Pseudomonas sp.]MBG0843479.1 AraC family transcriptional regulator [Pseudomonas toyotomiensis]MBG0848442.1 AraC family transcriptional regulator [Pseudomonas chengduensis]MBZ9668053.1 AraC family transcriptional regulator [Pseudomonas chaetocerotis]